MAKTISNLRTYTRLFLDEGSEADWLDSEVDLAINVYYHRLISAVVNVYEDFYVATDTFDITANQQEYDSDDGLATDILKIRRVEINYKPSDSNSKSQRALPIPIDQVRNRLNNTDIGSLFRPVYYVFGFESSLKIGLLPIPTEAGTGAGKVWYVQRQSDLSDSNTSVNIPYADQYFQLIAKGAAGDLLSKGQQEEVVAKKYIQEFENGAEKMQMELEDKLADDNKHVVDVEGDPMIADRPISL